MCSVLVRGNYRSCYVLDPDLDGNTLAESLAYIENRNNILSPPFMYVLKEIVQIRAEKHNTTGQGVGDKK